MRVLIFDDNKDDIEIIRTCCNHFFNKKKIKYTIDVCPNQSYLLKNINYYDMLFLDVEINTLNGIELGLEIRKANTDCRIIITSNYKEYLIDGYKINADRYFIKPISQLDFDIEMEAVVNRFFRNYLGIYDETICKRKIYYKEILYIESFDRRTKIHLLNGSILITNYPLKDWIEKLDQFSFAQSHKSYLINLSFITGFTKQDVILENNEKIPLSRFYKSSFNNKHFDYLHTNL